MKAIRIIGLHLAYGGVEKAICSMANLFAEKYEVEIICVYNMPDSPAFPLDSRVKLRYLLKETPNRQEWKAAVKKLDIPAIIRESIKSVRVLAGKKLQLIRAIRAIQDGVIITTRHEDNLLLSKYGSKNAFKIAQLHHDHNFERKYVRGFKRGYGNIDAFALLTPGLVSEAKEIMAKNKHTRLVYIPNFLERYPENAELEGREKLIVAVGRLHPVKGFDRLLSCFSKIRSKAPGWKIEIIGDGLEMERLKALSVELGIEQELIFTGKLDSARLEKEMLRASVFATTTYSEGFGFTIIEAMSCGLPAIAFDVRVGPGFIITDGQDGFLIPDGDEEQYAQKLLELIEAPELRRKMAVQAINRAGDFSRENVSKIWYDVIGE